MSQPVQTAWFGKLALALSGIAIALIAVEIVLQFSVPSLRYQFPSSRMTDDRFEQRAGRRFTDQGIEYIFDADGFRVDGAASPRDGRTVLFIGDSFTEGMGVAGDATFPALTCDRLEQRAARVRCLNAGVSGFGTSHELRLLERLLRRDPTIDAVVLQVLPNNDLRDNWEDGGFAIDGDRLTVCDPPCIPARVWWRDALLDNELARNSRIVTLSANALFNGLGMDPHYDANALALEQRLLEEIVATTKRRGIPIVVLVAATAWELDRMKMQPFDERARLDFVVDVVRGMHVPLVDSRTVASGLDHYIPGDGHFSAAGHALMADALATALVDPLGK